MGSFRFQQSPLFSLRIELINIVGSLIIFQQPSNQINPIFSSEQSMFGSVPRTTISFRYYFLPDKSRLLFIQRNRIEIVQTSVQNLITPIEIHPKLDNCYLFWNEHAALQLLIEMFLPTILHSFHLWLFENILETLMFEGRLSLVLGLSSLCYILISVWKRPI